MKVLVLCYEYPPVGGGGGRVAAQVAEGLVARGHSVKVVTAGLRHLAKREMIRGVDVHRPPSFRQREDTCTVPEMGLYLLTAFLPALTICQQWKPDVIHAHFVVPTGVLACVLNTVTGCPYVLTAHLGDVPGGVPEQTGHLFRVVGPLIRPIWKRAAGVTAVSSFVGGLAQAASRREARVILNGIPPLEKTPDIRKTSAPRLLLLGRLSIQKDPVLAIQALAGLREKHWHLDIIGEGPLRADVETAVAESGLADRVTFHGWLDAATVRLQLERSDLLLMTSRQEGLPVAAIEALHHGLAIVGSRIGGLQDVIADGVNGRLCDRNASAFSSALAEAMNSPDTLVRWREGSLRLAEQFRLADSLDAYESVLRIASERC
ncbi:MAG: glycosyltransferase family 4 protein [Terrimicrobiaceae bacterium]|nr:glycosyltransferase family 4 protein [Terrimicrobiaceae bacterium]